MEDLKKQFEGAIDSVREFFEQFDIHLPTLDDFRTLVEKVGTGIWNLGEKFQNAGSKVANFFLSVFPLTRKRFGIGQPVSDEMGEMAENVEGSAERTKTAFDYLIGAIDFVLDVAGHIVKRFVDIFHPVWDALLVGEN